MKYEDDINSNVENRRESINQTKLVSLLDLFDVLKGSCISEDEAKKCKEGDIRFVTSSKYNNGVKKKIDLVGIESTIYPPNCLSLAKNGSVGVCFYHDYRIVSTSDVLILKFKHKELNKFEGLFFKVLIEKHMFRFNYGRKINEERLSEIKLKIPITDDGEIDCIKINQLLKNVQYSDLI